MRIVIEIDGIEAIVKTPAEATDTTAPPASAPATELTNARIGAQDAGPAPTASFQTPGAPQAFMATGPAAPVAGASDLAAGAAPSVPSTATGLGAQAAGGSDIAASAAPSDGGRAPAADATGGGK